MDMEVVKQNDSCLATLVDVDFDDYRRKNDIKTVNALALDECGSGESVGLTFPPFCKQF